MVMAAKIGEKYSFPSRRNSNPSSTLAAKRSFSVNFSDVQTDILINVDGVSFSLHKFPLMARCGRIHRLAAEAISDSESGVNPVLELINFPGGAETFELAAKFCYGINFEITTANAAHLRCAAEHLEMTEEHGDGNLLSRTESFFTEIVLESLQKSVQLLRSCEPILPFAEEAKLVNRCIDAVACKASSDPFSPPNGFVSSHSSGRSDQRLNDGVGSGSRGTPAPRHSPHCRAVVEWWADDLSSLRVDLYQRVISAMKSRGLRAESLAGALMHFAQKTVKLMTTTSKGRPTPAGALDPGERASNDKALEHEQRILVESIVSLLPAQKNIFPTNFLLRLLRTAAQIDTTVACKLDLERRAGCQLEHASVDDLLIPFATPAAAALPEAPLFDVDVVQRVVGAFVAQLQQQHRDAGHVSDCQLSAYESDGLASPSQRSGLVKVAKLVDGYLGEIAGDPNLKASKFASVAELLPDYARILDDSLYRAIDIFLKAHPTLSELERKKMCKLLDCQKLSQEACTHAAQNERLPVQVVVQVLYFEQMRMRSAMSSAGGGNPPHEAGELQQVDNFFARQATARSIMGNGQVPVAASPKVDATSSLRRDNRELKGEVARLRVCVNDLETENSALKQELLAARRPSPVVTSTGSSGFLSFMSRRFGKMGLFASSGRSPREGGSRQQQAAAKTAPRRRRHSVS